ncbi:MAG: hypothetical protein ABEI52_12865 [Halobacteriaceae archaeon]
MNVKQIAIAIIAASVIMVGGVAAAPGNAPSTIPDGSNDGTNASAQGEEPEQNDVHVENATAGPPATLPDQVPNFVGQIHDTIRTFISGASDALGEVVSDIAGNSAQSSNSVEK